MKVLKRTSLQGLNVDITVQEKAVTFPTDSKLYHRMREKLVKEEKVCEVELRQSYNRLSKKSLIMLCNFLIGETPGQKWLASDTPLNQFLTFRFLLHQSLIGKGPYL
jgi:hypothetical protein